MSRRWYVVIQASTGKVVHSEQIHNRRDISSRGAEAWSPGTVYGTGDSEADAIHNAKMKAKHDKNTGQDG